MGHDFSMQQTPPPRPDLDLQNPDQPGYHRMNIRAMSVLIELLQVADAVRDAGDPKFPDFPFEDVERGHEILEYVQMENMFVQIDAHPDAAMAADDLEQIRAEFRELHAPTDEEKSTANAFMALHEAILTQPSDPGVPPPLYKFLYNDGWLVTAEEAKIVANQMQTNLEMLVSYLVAESHPEDDARTLLGCWIAYNTLAADYGGYRVH